MEAIDLLTVEEISALLLRRRRGVVVLEVPLDDTPTGRPGANVTLKASREMPLAQALTLLTQALAGLIDTADMGRSQKVDLIDQLNHNLLELQRKIQDAP